MFHLLVFRLVAEYRQIIHMNSLIINEIDCESI